MGMAKLVSTNLKLHLKQFNLKTKVGSHAKLLKQEISHFKRSRLIAQDLEAHNLAAVTN